MSPTIHSERLALIPMTPAFLRASLRQEFHDAEQELRVSLPAQWPGEDTDLLSLRLKQLEEDPTLQSWSVRAMARRAGGIMVGHIGFHTAPGADYLRPHAPGAVEFGFSVFPSFRRQGYAREAAVALMEWARQTHDVKRFVMSIRPNNVASQSLAAQLGFVRVGSHIDEVDGFEEILERTFSSDDAGPGAPPHTS